MKKSQTYSLQRDKELFKNFSYVEFENELNDINWSVLLQNKKSVDALKSFYDTIEKLLDEMAPYKTLSKKEQNLQQRPCVSGDILSEMHTCDEIHKKFMKEKMFKHRFSEYKKKRNDVLSKIKNSRNNYFKDFFESHKSDMAGNKKHCQC